MDRQRNHCPLAVRLAILVVAPFLIAATTATENSYLNRPPEDEIIYFVLPDRFENADPSNDKGGLEGSALDHGYDPTHKGFFHGGDLKGLTARLDYIQSLGASAIWLGPIYKNKPVQGKGGTISAGYHGYWITDFTSVDPHFGTETDLKDFIDAAHDRDMKIYLDIITNHTADVIAYRECHDPAYQGGDKTEDGCKYRSKADYPYATRGLADNKKINDGFMGDRPPFQTGENFKRLVRNDYAYTPYISKGEETVKKPAWLNDPIYYHNRGDTHWKGESVTYGDFAGLDDLLTEHPRVVSGMIEIYQGWISKYKIDGFRIDTAKHVNSEFWQAFTPAIIKHAKNQGIPNFYIFGEAYAINPAQLARHTRVDGFPYVLDFGFQSVLRKVVADGEPASRFAEFFAIDDLYEGGAATARGLPIFTGNHDMGRFAMFIRQKNPDIDNEEMLQRLTLANAMMFFLRGAPVIYYGDEQGFISDNGDQGARENMFPSKVASYNDNILIGTKITTAESNFDRAHPLYQSIAKLSKTFRAHKALRRGEQIIRIAEEDGGLLAVSRMGENGGEYLVAFNVSDTTRRVNVTADPRSTKWRSISGRCPARSVTAGSVRISVPAWSYVICKSNEWSHGQ